MIRAEFPSVWKDYNNRRRVKQLVARLFWMAVGGGLALATLPYFPPAWAGWVGDRQDDITQRVNWGETAQSRVVFEQTMDVADEDIDGVVLESTAIPATETDDTILNDTRFAVGKAINLEEGRFIVSERWAGTGDFIFDYEHSTDDPFILRWDTNQTSVLGSKFEVQYIPSEDVSLSTGTSFDWLVAATLTNQPGGGHQVIADSGTIRIQVRASGVEWQILALREP